MELLDVCFNNNLGTLAQLDACQGDQDLEYATRLAHGQTITPKSFYFLRHGVTDWSKEMLAQGEKDLPMNEKGFRQIAEAVNTLLDKNITLILSSTLTRCNQTTSIVKNAFPDARVIHTEDLRERYFGDWSTVAEKAEALLAKAPDGPLFFQTIKDEIERLLPSDAETQLQFETRIINLFNYYLSLYQNETILMVGHGCIRHAFIKYIEPKALYYNASYYSMPINFTVDHQKEWHVHMLDN